MCHVALPQSAKRRAGPAPFKPPVTRQVRADQLRRARAAARVMRTAFPEVEQLRIELSFEDQSSVSPTAQAHVLYPPAPAFFTYLCPYSDCDGQFELEDAVHKAIGARAHAAHGALL